MRSLKLLFAAAVFAILVAAPVAARAAEQTNCSLGQRYHVTAVSPFRSMESAYGPTRRLRGAELYVPAQPGLTSEWLQRVVESDIAYGRCDFGDPKATVDVTSAGAGFWVRITASNSGDSDEIVRQAQLMMGPAR
jgi:hypothetical protein